MDLSHSFALFFFQLYFNYLLRSTLSLYCYNIVLMYSSNYFSSTRSPKYKYSNYSFSHNPTFNKAVHYPALALFFGVINIWSYFYPPMLSGLDLLKLTVYSFVDLLLSCNSEFIFCYEVHIIILYHIIISMFPSYFKVISMFIIFTKLNKLKVLRLKRLSTIKCMRIERRSRWYSSRILSSRVTRNKVSGYIQVSLKFSPHSIWGVELAAWWVLYIAIIYLVTSEFGGEKSVHLEKQDDRF
jgi:hypothetical protein